MIDRKGDWIQTFSGHPYWPMDPRIEDVHVVDIAHALSNLCRYTGHVRTFYSVAEHSVYVSMLVPEEHAFCALLHDAPEAYVNDLARPLKKQLADYQAAEQLNWLVVADRFGLPKDMPACVHEADNAMLRAERQQLMAPSTKDWALGAGEVPQVGQLGMLPQQAEAAFLRRFHILMPRGH